VIRETLAAVETFAAGTPRSDDVTLLALRYRSVDSPPLLLDRRDGAALSPR